MSESSYPPQLYDRMASALRMAYLKHHCLDTSIGWHELDDLLLDVLCEVMGDRAFQAWFADETKETL